MFKKIITVIAVAIAASSSSAHALDCSEPKAYVDSVKTDVLNVLSSQDSDAQKQAKLDSTFRQVADIDFMAKFVLGRNYSQLTPEQQAQYSKVYADYLTASYVQRFREYNGETVVVNAVKPVNNDFVVDTTINRPSKAPVDVSYRLRKEGGCFKISDIVAEGVSLINTQRQDFNSAFGQRGFDGLIQLLKDKTAQMNK